VDPALCLRLLGRHGAETPLLVEAAQPGELQPIEGTLFTWAELRWAAREEGVVHLDDLLLRRLRLGLTLPEGGLAHLDRIRSIAQPELGWDDKRWTEEVERYRELWRAGYSPPAS
jgi:glycerol-3-phosphate dehydrogenase